MSSNKIVIQRYPGSYHDVATHEYFNLHDNHLVPADSFNILADKLVNDSSIDYGVMAIENSIAGSIIQNYKIIKDIQLYVHDIVEFRIYKKADISAALRKESINVML